MPELNGLGLLTIGLCAFAAVLVFAVYFALKAWRLARRGFRISKVALPLAEGLARRSEDLTRLGYKIGQEADHIAVTINELDAAVRRLQVLLQAFTEATRPYRKIREYLGL